MKVEQINVGNLLRNFIYIIYDEDSKKAWCIDPFSAKAVQKFLDEHDLNLEMVINTHSHFDHTKGNEKLVSDNNAKLWDLSDLSTISLINNYYIEIHPIAGHLNDHVGLLLKKDDEQIGFFCGDTVFHNSVGNITNGGDINNLYESINFMKKNIEAETVLYVGHDYGVNNMKFLLSLEKNPLLEEEIKFFSSSNLRAFSFKRELELNPFFQVKSFEEFKELRLKRDKW